MSMENSRSMRDRDYINLINSKDLEFLERKRVITWLTNFLRTMNTTMHTEYTQHCKILTPHPHGGSVLYQIGL